LSNGNIDKLIALLKTEEEEEEIRNIVLAEKKQNPSLQKKWQRRLLEGLRV
jgi:hypothetical protein